MKPKINPVIIGAIALFLSPLWGYGVSQLQIPYIIGVYVCAIPGLMVFAYIYWWATNQ
jgi:hypothetical protein